MRRSVSQFKRYVMPSGDHLGRRMLLLSIGTKLSARTRILLFWTTSFKPSVDSRTSSMVHALCFNHTCPNLQQNSHIHWSIQIFTNIYHNIINLSTFERDFQALSDDMYLEDPSSGLGGILTPTFHKCALSSIRSDLHHYPLPYRQCTHIRKAFPNAFRRSTHLQDPPSGWKDMVCVTITLKEDGQWYLWEPS